VDPAERLADYLAGELDADERAALEAELARDPRLRAQLDAIRQADAALGQLASPVPPEGFEQRLRTALEDELERQLAPAVRPAAAPADELARRRERRFPAWVPRLAGAAAVLVLLAGVLVTTGLPGTDDAVFEAADAPDVAADDAPVAEDAPDEPVEGAPEAMAAPGDGPVLMAADRELDEELLAGIVAGPELLEVAQRRLDTEAGRALALRWRDTLRAEAPVAPEPDDADHAELRVFSDDPIGPAEREVIDRCLDAILDDAEPAIPAYVELARYAGQDAIVVGLVTRDPATAAFTGTEVWVVDRDTCEVLRFTR
jgi:hypothetical protein